MPGTRTPRPVPVATPVADRADVVRRGYRPIAAAQQETWRCDYGCGRRREVGYKVTQGADPTAVTLLRCGHVIL